MWATCISKMWSFLHAQEKSERARALINSVIVFCHSNMIYFQILAFQHHHHRHRYSFDPTEPNHTFTTAVQQIYLILRCKTAALSASWSICQVYSNSKIYAFEMKAIEGRRKMWNGMSEQDTIALHAAVFCASRLYHEEARMVRARFLVYWCRERAVIIITTIIWTWTKLTIHSIEKQNK